MQVPLQIFSILGAVISEEVNKEHIPEYTACVSVYLELDYMYTCIHIYICLHAHTYTLHTCLCVYIYIHLYIYIDMFYIHI